MNCVINPIPYNPHQPPSDQPAFLARPLTRRDGIAPAARLSFSVGWGGRRGNSSVHRAAGSGPTGTRLNHARCRRTAIATPGSAHRAHKQLVGLPTPYRRHATWAINNTGSSRSDLPVPHQGRVGRKRSAQRRRREGVSDGSPKGRDAQRLDAQHDSAAAKPQRTVLRTTLILSVHFHHRRRIDYPHSEPGQSRFLPSSPLEPVSRMTKVSPQNNPATATCP